MTIEPAYPTTREGVARLLRGRVTWKYAPQSVQDRFLSLYLHHAVTPDKDVLTAWVWYYRGYMWEHSLNEPETPP